MNGFTVASNCNLNGIHGNGYKKIHEYKIIHIKYGCLFMMPLCVNMNTYIYINIYRLYFGIPPLLESKETQDMWGGKEGNDRPRMDEKWDLEVKQHFLLLTMDQMPSSILKGVTCCDEPTDNEHRLCSSSQFCRAFQRLRLIVLCLWPTVVLLRILSYQHRFQTQPAAVSSDAALMNPVHTPGPTPNGRQTTLATSWGTTKEQLNFFLFKESECGTYTKFMK